MCTKLDNSLLSCLEQQSVCVSLQFSTFAIPTARVIEDALPPFVVTFFYYKQFVKQSVRIATFLAEHGEYGLDVRVFGSRSL